MDLDGMDRMDCDRTPPAPSAELKKNPTLPADLATELPEMLLLEANDQAIRATLAVEMEEGATGGECFHDSMGAAKSKSVMRSLRAAIFSSRRSSSAMRAS